MLILGTNLRVCLTNYLGFRVDENRGTSKYTGLARSHLIIHKKSTKVIFIVKIKDLAIQDQYLIASLSNIQRCYKEILLIK